MLFSFWKIEEKTVACKKWGGGKLIVQKNGNKLGTKVVTGGAVA